MVTPKFYVGVSSNVIGVALENGPSTNISTKSITSTYHDRYIGMQRLQGMLKGTMLEIEMIIIEESIGDLRMS